MMTKTHALPKSVTIDLVDVEQRVKYSNDRFDILYSVWKLLAELKLGCEE